MSEITKATATPTICIARQEWYTRAALSFTYIPGALQASIKKVTAIMGAMEHRLHASEAASGDRTTPKYTMSTKRKSGCAQRPIRKLRII